MNKHKLMKFNPATGEPKPYPSHAEQWREWHGVQTAFLFNPWTGKQRDAYSVGSDPFGYLIDPDHEELEGADVNATDDQQYQKDIETALIELVEILKWMSDIRIDSFDKFHSTLQERLTKAADLLNIVIV